MARFLHHDFQFTHRRKKWFPLAFSFTLGLLSGGYLFLQADISFFSMMCLAAGRRVSIVSLACVVLLPFLLSAFAVYLCKPRILLLVAYGKALVFSYVSLGVLAAYGAGGWLALPLLMFSDLSMMPLIWLFWLRHSDASCLTAGEAAWYFSCAALIGSLDYFIVSPFLAGL